VVSPFLRNHNVVVRKIVLHSYNNGDVGKMNTVLYIYNILNNKVKLVVASGDKELVINEMLVALFVLVDNGDFVLRYSDKYDSLLSNLFRKTYRTDDNEYIIYSGFIKSNTTKDIIHTLLNG
jgi:hypothetical protein